MMGQYDAFVVRNVVAVVAACDCRCRCCYRYSRILGRHSALPQVHDLMRSLLALPSTHHAAHVFLAFSYTPLDLLTAACLRVALLVLPSLV